ncbi:MAG: hypothetical protein WC564_03685 [Patescibacteria group bacterium]
MRKFFRARHEKHYKNSKFHLVADITFVLVVLVLFVAFIAISNWKPKSSIVLESRPLSESVKSGELESFELSYHANKDSTNNFLVVKLPNNFILDNVEPAESFDRNSNTFYINDLDKGGDGKIKITGLVLGEVGSKSDFGFIFNCSECPGGVIQSLPFEIGGSVISANIELPENIYRGVEFSGMLKIKNNSQRELRDIQIKINDSWQMKGGNELSLDKIGSGEERTINFVASTKSSKNNEAFSFDYYLKVNNEFLKQGTFNRDLTIKDPNFKVFIDTDQKIISSDEDIIYSISYQNQENISLSDIKFSLFSGNPNFKIISWSLISSDPLIKDQGSSLTLNKNLEPDSGGRFKVRVKYARVKAGINEELYLGLNNRYNLNNQSLSYDLFSLRTKINSQLKPRSGAYYYSPQGDQLGVGPLPPQVGMATSYWIFWEIENIGNELENLIISADVPEDIVWMDNKSLLAGSLHYDETIGRVTWDVPAVASRTERGQYRAGFSLGVIPENKDLGKTLILLQNIKYTALDKFTDQKISGSLKNLSTSLDADILGGGKGKVVVAD